MATLRNWTGDEGCAPARIVRPGGVNELASAVAAATARGETVRAVGAGHSFTDLACTDGTLVDLSRMTGVRAVDAATGRVTVGAGTTLHELGPQLAEHGLALENQGDVDAQTIAGAVATGTHGTGARFRNLSSTVVGMRLVTATGDLVEVAGGDGLRAARVSLGALGIATEVTLQAVPSYTLVRRDEPRPLAAILDGLEELVDTHDHFEFWVFPYTRTALVRTLRRTDDPGRPTPRIRRTLQEDVIENAALGAVCRAGRAAPRLVPRANRLITAAMSASTVTDVSYRVYASKRAVRFTEMEYALPRAAAREVVERVLALVEARRLPILFPLEVRFAAPDDAFLSTAGGRDTCYVAVHQYAGMAYEGYFRAVEAIMDEHGGRPHWGKRHYQRAATLAERYPDWDRFQAVRDQLDPTRTFTNDHVRRVLG